MPKVNLSNDFVSKAECSAGNKKIVYWDNSIKGLIYELRKSGGTFALRYRDAQNRQCQYKICQKGEMSVDRIKKKAEKIRARVLLGESPSEDKKKNKIKIPT